MNGPVVAWCGGGRKIDWVRPTGAGRLGVCMVHGLGLGFEVGFMDIWDGGTRIVLFASASGGRGCWFAVAGQGHLPMAPWPLVRA